jgi:hypothetical protein
MALFEEIRSEYQPQFDAVGIDFMSEYLTAYGRVKHYEPSVAKDAIKRILSAILEEYSRSQSTTKVGRILRIISRILAPIVKIFK